MATYAENSSYFQSVNCIHMCLLSISNAGAQVERIQVKPTGTSIQIRNASEIEHVTGAEDAEHDGVKYKQTELCGCTVFWKAA